VIADTVVVVGASAGGVEALIALVAGLPPELPAAVCVVLHTPPHATSHLPQILGRSGPLPVAHATHGAPLLAGRIFIAPPDHHLLVRPGQLEVGRGPRENRSRPAIDPLFRSAARAYGSRAIAVVLSGTLDDGATGLLSVRAHGGTLIVQDPADALYDGMPLAALRAVRPDHVLPLAGIAPLLVDLCRQASNREGATTMAATTDMVAPESDSPGEALVRHDLTAQAAGARSDQLAPFACPECGGTLWQLGADEEAQFRCHTGHIYSPLALLAQQSEDLEAALWRCVRMLTEKATLARQLAAQALMRGNAAAAARIHEQVSLDELHSRVLREQLLGDPPGSQEQALAVDAALTDAGLASE